jgi:hypothetical protein
MQSTLICLTSLMVSGSRPLVVGRFQHTMLVAHVIQLLFTQTTQYHFYKYAYRLPASQTLQPIARAILFHVQKLLPFTQKSRFFTDPDTTHDPRSHKLTNEKQSSLLIQTNETASGHVCYVRKLL